MRLGFRRIKDLFIVSRMEDSSGEDISGLSFMGMFSNLINPREDSQIQIRLNRNGIMDVTYPGRNSDGLLMRNRVLREATIGLLRDTFGQSMFRNVSLRNILRESMNDTGGVKKVASDEVLKAISELPEATDIPDEEECPICMDGYGDISGVRVECGHIFHKECITEWLMENNQCPVCRHEYPCKEVSLMPSISNEEDTHDPDEASSDSDIEDGPVM